MRRITLAFAVVVALAAPVAAQESALASERRGTIGAAILHFASDDRRWPCVGFNGTFCVGRFEVQETYFRDTVRYEDFDPEYAWTRILEWYSGGIIWPLSQSPARFRPHVLTGFQLFRDMTSDGFSPHRRPAIYGGLGAEFPLGGRLFARAQYMTLAVYEEIYVGHAGRASIGIGFQRPGGEVEDARHRFRERGATLPSTTCRVGTVRGCSRGPWAAPSCRRLP